MPKTIFSGDHAHLVAVLVAARKESGLTQAQVAAQLGGDQTLVSLIERSQRRVDVIELIGFAKAIGRDPVELLAEVVARIDAAPQ